MNRIWIRGKVIKEWKIFMLEDKKNPGRTYPMAVTTLVDSWKGSITYHDVMAYGEVADLLTTTVANGDTIELKGVVKTRRFTGKDGVSRSRNNVEIKEFKKYFPPKKKPVSYDIPDFEGDGEEEPEDDGI